MRVPDANTQRSPLVQSAPSLLEGEGWGGGYKANANLKASPPSREGEGWGGGYKANANLKASPPSRRSQISSATVDLPLKGGGNKEHTLTLAGVTLAADPAGALYWPDERLLVVADLHLEKGSAYAERGVLLPPYDTATTLARLARLLDRHAPRLIIALGDSFHDSEGPSRMTGADRHTLKALQRARDWVWIAGNHDSDLKGDIGGQYAASVTLGALTLHHAPSDLAADGEIAGHLHPVACIARRARAVRRRCFAGDGRRLVMPAFGAYVGGLNVCDRAITALFGARAFTAHMLGERRLYAVAAERCLPD